MLWGQSPKGWVLGPAEFWKDAGVPGRNAGPPHAWLRIWCSFHSSTLPLSLHKGHQTYSKWKCFYLPPILEDLWTISITQLWEGSAFLNSFVFETLSKQKCSQAGPDHFLPDLAWQLQSNRCPLLPVLFILLPTQGRLETVCNLVRSGSLLVQHHNSLGFWRGPG